MNFENITVSEISQTKKRANIIGSHVYQIPRIGKSIETEIRTEVTRDWGKRRMGN